MSVWKYIEGDTYTHGQLDKLVEYYQIKSLKDLAEYRKLKSYEKFGLPGYRWMLLHAKTEWEDNMESLENLDKAIKAEQEIKDRKQDLDNHAS